MVSSMQVLAIFRVCKCVSDLWCMEGFGRRVKKSRYIKKIGECERKERD